MVSARLVFIACTFSSSSIHALRINPTSASPHADGGKEPAKVLEQWMRDSACLDINTGSRTINLKDPVQILGLLQSPILLGTLVQPLILKEKSNPIPAGSGPGMLFGAGTDKENHFSPWVDSLAIGKDCCQSAGQRCFAGCWYHEHDSDDYFKKEHHEDDYLHCMNEAAIHCGDVDTCSEVFCMINSTANAMFNGRPRDAGSPAFTKSTTHPFVLNHCTSAPKPSFVETQSQPRCSNLLQLTQLGAKPSILESDAGASVTVSLQVPELSKASWSEAPLGVLNKYDKLLKQPLQLVQTSGNVKHYKVIDGNA